MKEKALSSRPQPRTQLNANPRTRVGAVHPKDRGGLVIKKWHGVHIPGRNHTAGRLVAQLIARPNELNATGDYET